MTRSFPAEQHSPSHSVKDLHEMESLSASNFGQVEFLDQDYKYRRHIDTDSVVVAALDVARS